MSTTNNPPLTAPECPYCHKTTARRRRFWETWSTAICKTPNCGGRGELTDYTYKRQWQWMKFISPTDMPTPPKPTARRRIIDHMKSEQHKKDVLHQGQVIAIELRQSTIAIVNTLLDVHTYSRDSFTILQVAEDAGLWPLKKHDRAILKKSLGQERLAKFETICKAFA